ncbi:hypothetical protein AA3271_1514 [Gluconobacter japonicus NBRC 3271]|nr:hypothetical protein AA3271_1514 [Gluconobacter japonicus NBRC 3271]
MVEGISLNLKWGLWQGDSSSGFKVLIMIQAEAGCGAAVAHVGPDLPVEDVFRQNGVDGRKCQNGFGDVIWRDGDEAGDMIQMGMADEVGGDPVMKDFAFRGQGL